MNLGIDLVVTRHKEPLAWVAPFTERPRWRVFLYNTGPRPPPRRLCRQPAVTCTQVGNAGYEWHGYLRHLIDHYESMASSTIFMQGDPTTVSPDIDCLLNQTERYKPLQPLSWVQMAKRSVPLFSECQTSFVGGCRVWVEPVTAGLRPMLHGDRWLHRACRLAKRFRGGLWQFLYAQLAGDAGIASGPASRHVAAIRQQVVPPRLYRAYGSQFSATRDVLLARPRAFYERLLLWLVTPHDAMHTRGFLAMWRAYTTKEKAILLELMWMSILGAERYYVGDACADCLPVARRMPRPAGEPSNAPGPSCDSDYFSGAPRVEPCNVTGDGWGGKPPCTNYCGRLKTVCPITRNDDEAHDE